MGRRKVAGRRERLFGILSNFPREYVSGGSELCDNFLGIISWERIINHYHLEIRISLLQLNTTKRN